VTSAADFDPSALDGYLEAELGWRGPLKIERIAGGQSNPTYFIDKGPDRAVLRKKPEGDILPSAHAVDREFRILSALTTTDVPTPKTIAFHADPVLLGTPFYLMERLEGRVFHDNALPGLSPDERRRAWLSLAETLARLHRVAPRAIGLEDFGRPGNYFARQIARWSKQWELSKTREIPDLEHLVPWLATNIPDDDASAIVHGDYRFGNVMLHPSEPRVIAILDWELSTLGHPLADLAHSCIAWHARPDDYGGILGLDLAALGAPEEREYVDAYMRAAGSVAPLRPFHLAFALFRFAVIFEGVASRALNGNASSADARKVGALSAIFARRAVEVAEGRAHA
jgi:aminoglycoside phosphotransferase (APT) family kinase protein